MTIMMTPIGVLSLTAPQMRHVQRYVQSLPELSRDPFLKAVAARLAPNPSDLAVSVAINHGLDLVKETLP